MKPVWGTPTGLYVRSFIERVIDYAVVRGLREGGLNPARLKGNIAVLMPRAKVATVYHDALDWRLVPAVYARLRAMDGVRPAALRLLILTALRSNEVRSLRWSDIRDDRIIIDGSKYKTRREHQVPLTDAMREVLTLVAVVLIWWVVALMHWSSLGAFATARCRRIRSNTCFAIGVPCKPHGFWTSFAVWCVEAGNFTDDIAQRCLGHVVGNAVSRAYQRSHSWTLSARCLKIGLRSSPTQADDCLFTRAICSKKGEPHLLGPDFDAIPTRCARGLRHKMIGSLIWRAGNDRRDRSRQAHHQEGARLCHYGDRARCQNANKKCRIKPI